MGLKSKVQTFTRRAIHAKTVEEKLDAIARAIEELADFVDDIENDVRRIKSATRS